MLNVTSRKKRDTMLCATNTTAATPAGGTSYGPGPAVMTAANTYMFPWIATWRDNSVATGTAPIGTVFDPATRTATTCYMRGLKEANTLVANDGSQWMWRRICFTWKGSELYQQTTSGFSFAFENSSGNRRLVNDIQNGSTTITGSLIALLFKGSQGSDWANYFNAPVDNTRVSIKSDKTRRLTSGNQNGTMRVYKDWYPMNKNLVYDDDENGGNESSAAASVRGKQGMGDYYIIDIFACPAPQQAGTASTLAWAPEATLYWHEK